MAARDLKAQLEVLIDSMLAENILNNFYYELEMLRTAKNPGLLAKILTDASEEGRKIIQDLENTLNKDVLDYEEIYGVALRVHSCISYVGGERVVRASRVLRQFCTDKNKEGCAKTIAEIRQEYTLLKSKLDTIIQLETQIMMVEAEAKKRKYRRRAPRA